MKELFLSFLRNSVTNGAVLMGDDIIGYKFVGENSGLLNDILATYDYDLLTENLNYNTLKLNDIEFEEFNAKVW